MNFAIIAVGYNRLASMERLLKSICNAKYTQNVDLIISLDKSDKQEDLVSMTESIKWEHGEKKTRAFETRQGLRNHILQCGDLTNQYDAVIVLEDDLVVSTGFFDYIEQAVRFYWNDDKIAGISLYSHKTNPGNGRCFEAVNNGYDTFLMQYAQSWGQCWTRRMWNCFREWYNNNTDFDFNNTSIPDYVGKWNSQSWLKYFIAFCAEKKQYYVYPYISMTTNHTEIGEHNVMCDSSYQVPILHGIMNRSFLFPKYNDAIKYDSFFEREELIEFEEKYEGKCLIDLYGLRTKYDGYKYIASTNRLPYQVLSIIGLQYRPHEMNLLYNEPGEGIYIYDLTKISVRPKRSKYAIAKYELKALSSKLTLSHALHGIKAKLGEKL